MNTTVITPECINEVMSCKMSVNPTPGMLGTMFVGSDRYIVVCSKVFSPKRIQVLQFLPDNIIAQKIVDENGIERLTPDALAAAIELNVPTIESMTARYKKWGYPLDNIDRDFEIELNHFEHESNYSLRKNGRWMSKGSGAWGTCSIHWGVGDEYRDPSF